MPGKDNTIYFTPDGLTLAFTSALGAAEQAVGARPDDKALLSRGATDPTAAAKQGWVVKLDFVGANPAVQPVGNTQTQAVFSYFSG